MHCDNFLVLTGGPGFGKTTLIDALARAGFSTTLEAGRGTIRDQLAIGGSALPWGDPALFAELMLAWEMRSYAQALDEPGPVFFDRGLPDVVGYLRVTGLTVPPHIQKAAQEFRYNCRVLIAPPWPGIFAQDAERKQSLAEAGRTHDAMAETYSTLGYELVPLPLAPVEERIEFVLGMLPLSATTPRRGATAGERARTSPPAAPQPPSRLPRLRKPQA